MPGNPGFEFEIEFVSNFGVRLYNADGTDTPVLLTTLAEDDYSQRAVAITSQCSNPDYFYDFYMPLSVVQTFFPTITEATPLRMVGNTVISTQSALRGPISDINGVNDSAYGSNPDNPWEDLIDGQVPTPLDSAATSGFPPHPLYPAGGEQPHSRGCHHCEWHQCGSPRQRDYPVYGWRLCGHHHCAGRPKLDPERDGPERGRRGIGHGAGPGQVGVFAFQRSDCRGHLQQPTCHYV